MPSTPRSAIDVAEQAVPRAPDSLPHCMALALDSDRTAADLAASKALRDLVAALSRRISHPIHRAVYWRWCLTAATVAGRLTEGFAPGAGGQAFLAGMLADVGVVILNQAAPVRYAPVAAWYGREGLPAWLHLERKVAGEGHAPLASRVLADWGVGEEVCEAVRWHHVLPREVPEDSPGRWIATALWMANRLADGLWSALDAADTERLAMHVAERAGLSPVDVLAHLRGVGDDLLDRARVLGIHMEFVDGWRHFGDARAASPGPRARLGIARVVSPRRSRG